MYYEGEFYKNSTLTFSPPIFDALMPLIYQKTILGKLVSIKLARPFSRGDLVNGLDLACDDSSHPEIKSEEFSSLG